MLNELDGDGRTVGHNDRLTSAQREAVRRLACMYGSVEHTTEGAMGRHEAWEKLSAGGGGYDDGAARQYALYRPGQVAIPAGRCAHVPLLDVMPPSLRGLLDSAAGGLLRSKYEATTTDGVGRF